MLGGHPERHIPYLLESNVPPILTRITLEGAKIRRKHE